MLLSTELGDIFYMNIWPKFAFVTFYVKGKTSLGRIDILEGR